MNDLFMSEPPPDVDAYAPKLCFCGKKTVECHEFWFCSTKCARLDALRSLDDPECHYRNNVRRAYVQAGIQELYPRRMMSVDQLRPGPIAHHVVVNSPAHLPSPTNATHSRHQATVDLDALDRNMVGYPALSQVTGNVLDKWTPGGEIPGRHDHAGWEIPPRAPSRAQHRDERVEEELMRNFPQPAPARTLRRGPQSINNLRSNIRTSVAALFSRSRKDKSSGNPERVFGHVVNTIVPPVRKESLPSNRQPITRDAPSAASASKSKALRRSRSCAVGSLVDKRDTVMYIIEEMRAEMAGSFDPRSLFNNDEDED